MAVRDPLKSRFRNPLCGAAVWGTWLAVALLGELPTAAAGPFDDAVRVRERLRQRFRRGADDTWAVESRARLRARVAAEFPTVDFDDLDADSVLRFRSGAYEFSSRLGDAVNYRPGGRRFTFRAGSRPDGVVTVHARIRRIGWEGSRLALRVRGSGVPLVCDAARGASSGEMPLPLDAAVSLHGTTSNFAGDGPAEVSTRTLDVLGQTVPVSSIDYAARATLVRDDADGNAPTVAVSAPGDGAVLSGDSVTLSGVARDDQSLVEVTVQLNGGPPMDVAFLPREGDGGLGSVEADFSATLNTLVGTNSLTVTARDAAGNSAESTVSFVYSVPRTVKVSLGGAHTLFVDGDGRLHGCGWNAFGQCGDGTRDAKYAPTLVPDVTGVRAVAAGGGHSLLLLDDGSVVAIGDNRSGQIGDGTHETRTSPTPVVGLGSGVVAVAAGPQHSIAVRADGTVWAWGSNQGGLFGSDIGDANGTIDVPRKVDGIDDGVDVATGVRHSVILASDGTVWTLGVNASGELGVGSGYPTGAVRVPDLSGVIAIEAGAYHSLARHGDGSVSGWGSNDTLVLGPTKSTERSPIVVPDLSGVTELTSGYFYALFLDADGGLRARGNIGQLFGPTGDFATDTLPTTAPLDLLEDVVGAWASDHYAILQRADGTLWGVGFNNWGQLGNGTKSEEFVTTVTRVLLPE